MLWISTSIWADLAPVRVSLTSELIGVPSPNPESVELEVTVGSDIGIIGDILLNHQPNRRRYEDRIECQGSWQ